MHIQSYLDLRDAVIVEALKRAMEKVGIEKSLRPQLIAAWVEQFRVVEDTHISLQIRRALAGVNFPVEGEIILTDEQIRANIAAYANPTYRMTDQDFLVFIGKEIGLDKLIGNGEEEK